MPFFAFILSRPEVDEQLPSYSRVSLPPVTVRGGHCKQLSTIVEVEETDAQVATPTSSWSFADFRPLDYPSMVPQALLVDASTTLCAYLYFTSMQARLVLQQQNAVNIISSICSRLPAEVDIGTLERCTQGIIHAQSPVALPFWVSHRTVILFTLLKAVLGHMILSAAPDFIKPFDFLVASGASHCLALYCFFFVPVANYLDSLALQGHSIWARVSTQFLWLLAACSLVVLVHYLLKAFLVREQPSLEPSAVSDDNLQIEKV